MKVLLKCCLIILFITFSVQSLAAQPLEARPPSDETSRSSHKSQEERKDEYSLLNADYWKGYVTNLGKALTWPLRWERSDVIKTSVFLSITAGLYVLDSEIQEWVQENRSSSTDEISDIINSFGEAYLLIPGLGVLYTFGRISENDKAQETALLGLQSYALANAITQGIKRITHRHRPRSGADFNTWDGPSFSGENTSFPSGHAASAFTVASVIDSEYEDNVYVPVVAYGLATLTALSRVHDNDHWMSDVFFGAAIGYGMGKLVYNERPFKNKKKLVLVPYVRDNSIGLSVYWQF